MKRETKQYDVTKRNQANLRATFRGVVCMYLLYLAWHLTMDNSKPTSMAPWLGWLFGVLFAVAAVAFGVYTWKSYRREMERAELPEESEQGEEPS